MDKSEQTITFIDMIKTISRALDLISSTVVGHHKKVAYIAYRLGKRLNLNRDLLYKLVISALIHDIGVFYLNQRFSDLSFDRKDNRHALVGYLLLEEYFPLPGTAVIIKNHHLEYRDISDDISKTMPEEILLGQLIHLADRIAVLLPESDSELDVLQKKNKVKTVIANHSGQWFWPEAVEEFYYLTEREAFWLDVVNQQRSDFIIEKFFSDYHKPLSTEELLNISKMMSQIIDFRSPFTATHSQGIAEVAINLARKSNISEQNCLQIKVAALLHDLGKLIIPLDILEKADKLEKQEWAIMRSHSYYSNYCLQAAESMANIREWASYHHEKLNGQGYPFGLESNLIPYEAKLIAVADIFTALTEDRPYRKGMKIEKVRGILAEQVSQGELEPKVTAIITDNLAEFNGLRKTAQKKTRQKFKAFQNKVEEQKRLEQGV